MGAQESKSTILSSVIEGSSTRSHSAIFTHPNYNRIVLPKIFGCSNIFSLLELACNKFASQPFLGKLYKEDYVWTTYEKFYKNALSLLASFQTLEIPENKFGEQVIGILSAPTGEVMLTDITTIASGMITVSLFHRESAAEILSKIREIDLKVIFLDSNGLSIIKSILESGYEVPLQLVVLYEDAENSIKGLFASLNIQVVLFKALISFEPCYLFREPDPKSLCIFTYTNGTTQDPRLVKLSHQDIMSSLTSIVFQSFDLCSEDVYLMYTSFALFGERIMLYSLTIYGVAIGFSQDMMNDAKFLRPTLMIAIPRVLDVIKKQILKRLAKESGIKQKIFNKVFASSLKQIESKGKPGKNIVNKLVFRKIKEKFGGRLKNVLTGSAPLYPDTLKFIKICLEVEVFEGYGLVEAGYSNLYADNGFLKPLIGSQVKLKYIPELNIEGLDKTCYGELCIKLDYFKATYQDKEDQEWLSTGDLFYLEKKNFGFKFLERLAFCVEGRSGYTVFPQKLESIYRENPFVAQILVVADCRIDGVVAIVVVDEEHVKGLWGSSFSLEEWCENEILYKDIMNNFQKISSEKKLRHYECVIDMITDVVPWVSNEFVTGSLKLKRKAIVQKYHGKLESIIEKRQRSLSN